MPRHQARRQAHRRREEERPRGGRRRFRDGRHDGRADRSRRAGVPDAAGARVRHAADRRRADLHGAAGHGDQEPGPRGPSFTGSQAGVITDSGHNKARIIDVTPGPHPRRRSTRAPSPSSPGSRASTRTRRTSRPSAAAAPTPRRSRSPRRSTPRSARSTPTSTACSPPTRASCRRPDEDRLDHLRGDAGAGGLRRQGAATPLRRVRPPVQACPIHVRSSFSRNEGTWVDRPTRPQEGADDGAARSSRVSRTTSARPRSRSSACPDKPGKAAAIFRAVADAEINIDMIVQNVSAAATGLTDISFTLPKTEGRRPSRR